MPSRADGPAGSGEAGGECGDGDDGGGRGYGAPRRRSSMGTKACPACSQANPLAQLSCSLCGAKFSVAHTSRLLQLWRQGDDSHAVGGTTRYAELERSVDPAAQQELQSADVTSDSFKLLPLDAQIQVMQEKAAHRLLAQTLHQQMLEELHKNPALAADPEQQLQFKRLAQQQLLDSMHGSSTGKGFGCSL